jgi:hypothetical protein
MRSSARLSANTFDTLWIEKGVSASPAAWTLPSARAITMPNCFGSTCASVGM